MSLDNLHGFIRDNKVRDVAEFLMTHPKTVAQADEDGRTPLMWSLSETQNTEMVSEVLKHAQTVPSFDIDAADNAGYTALHIAAAIGAALTDQVLSMNPVIDSRTNTGQTPLMLAVSKQHPLAVELLLQAGASPKTKDVRQVSALMRAVAIGNIAMTKLLLDNGAIVNATDSNGWSAVHYAFAEGRSDVLDLLVAHGGDLSKRSRDEELPVDVAPLGFKYKPK